MISEEEEKIAFVPPPEQIAALPELLTTREVADLLRIHPNTVRKWYNKGFLRGYRVGPRGDRRFPREDLIRILDLHQ